MANLINAKTSGAGGLETTADNTGNINIQSGGSTVMEVTSAGVAVTGSLTQNGGAYSTQPTFRNRIINGNMAIDQRNAGASVTPANNDLCPDRYKHIITQTAKYSAQQVSDAPSGFTNSLKITSLSAYSIIATDIFAIAQRIEGYNIADLAWGTADAKTVTISFWVKSSLTGTFGGAFRNNAANRDYPFSYTISSANTWEQKSITLPGDTTGTWVTNNGIGIRLSFGFGVGSTYSGTAGSWAASNIVSSTGATSVVGTSGATWQITGVQLETGTTATDFENLQYTTQLQLCQRYYYKLLGTNVPYGAGFSVSTTSFRFITFFPVEMRIAPTALETTGTPSNYRVLRSTAVTVSSGPNFQASSPTSVRSGGGVSSGLTTDGGVIIDSPGTAYLAWSAEL
jgi:hypothetical protein